MVLIKTKESALSRLGRAGSQEDLVKASPISRTLNDLAEYQRQVEAALQPLGQILDNISIGFLRDNSLDIGLVISHGFSGQDETISTREVDARQFQNKKAIEHKVDVVKRQSAIEDIITYDFYENGQPKFIDIRSSNGDNLQAGYDLSAPNHGQLRPSQYRLQQILYQKPDIKAEVCSRLDDNSIYTLIDVGRFGSQAITSSLEVEDQSLLVALKAVANNVVYGKSTYFSQPDNPYRSELFIVGDSSADNQPNSSGPNYELSWTYLHREDGRPDEGSYEMELSPRQSLF